MIATDADNRLHVDCSLVSFPQGGYLQLFRVLVWLRAAWLERGNDSWIPSITSLVLAGIGPRVASIMLLYRHPTPQSNGYRLFNSFCITSRALPSDFMLQAEVSLAGRINVLGSGLNVEGGPIPFFARLKLRNRMCATKSQKAPLDPLSN